MPFQGKTFEAQGKPAPHEEKKRGSKDPPLQGSEEHRLKPVLRREKPSERRAQYIVPLQTAGLRRPPLQGEKRDFSLRSK
jgi:hypothetical protein